MSWFIVAENIDDIQLWNIMYKRYYMLTNSTFYNEKGFHIIDFSDEIDSLISLSENINIVDDTSKLE